MVSRPISTYMPLSNGLLQRQCACGTHTAGGCECPECSKKKLGVRRKLSIGASNDPLELEADQVANQVMPAPTQSAFGGAPHRIQRFSGRSDEQLEAAPASVNEALANPGKPLESALQTDMEQRFGHDFSKVQVHTDTPVARSARDVHAKAYAVGSNIVFAAGDFTSRSHEGRCLLGHELTHVVQQTEPGVAKGLASRACQALERDFPLSYEASAISANFVSLSHDQTSTIIARYKDIIASLAGKTYNCAKAGKKVKEDGKVADLCGEAYCPGAEVTLFPDFGKAQRPGGPVVLHEAAHNAGACSDIDKGKGYPPADAENNAYSYELFATDVAAGYKAPPAMKKRDSITPRVSP